MKNNIVQSSIGVKQWALIIGVVVVVGLVAGIVGSSLGNMTGKAVTNVGAYRVDIPGSQRTSHFNYGASQDTYIRPGKDGGNVFMDYGNVLMGIYGGYVGIGTTSPTAKLDVNGDMKVNGDVKANNLYTKDDIDAKIGSLDVRITNLENPGSTPFSISAGSDTYAQIKTTIKDSNVVIPFVYTDGQKFVGNGKDSIHLLPVYNKSLSL